MMKPKSNRLYIVIIILLCVIALLLAGVLGVSLFRNKNVLPDKNNNNAEYALVTDASYDDNYTAVEISSNAGNIFLLPSEDAQLHLKIWADEDKVNIQDGGDLSGNLLRITANARSSRHFGFNNAKTQQVRIELYLPEDYAKTVSTKTNYGNVEAESFPSLQLKSESNYGNLTLAEVSSLEAECDYGSVKADKINAYIDAECAMGNIDIEELLITEASQMACDMGSIRIGNAPSAVIQANTDLGSVKVRPDPAGATVKLTLESDNGSITVE